MFRQDSVVAVDLGVAQVGHHGLLQPADLPLLLELPGPQPVLGVPEDVLECEPQHCGVLYLLEVEQESHLSLQSFAYQEGKLEQIENLLSYLCWGLIKGV